MKDDREKQKFNKLAQKKDILNNEDKLLQIYLNKLLLPNPANLKMHKDYYSDSDKVTLKN